MPENKVIWTREDFSVVCSQGEHVGYTVLAGVFLGVYVVGIPLVMFVLMWWNRKALHNENHPKHRWVNTALGGLFLQCKCYTVAVFNSV